MKRRKLLSVASMILLAALLCLSACGDKAGSETPYLAEEDSFLRDFRIEGENVVFPCHLTVFNPRDAETEVEITGYFPDDAASGLLLEETLRAVSAEDGSVSRFTLPPGRTELEVVFVGTHGASDVKQDRLLPEIEIVPAG